MEQEFVTTSINRKKKNRLAAGALAGLVLMVVGMTIWLWGYSYEHAILKVQSQLLYMSIHLEPEMQSVAAGNFRQGDTQGRGEADEKPIREVRVKSFAMGKFEVTFEEYDRFALATGRRVPEDQGWGRGRQPVINVSWQDAKAYADWLSIQTKQRYRLPTESEWEYAARIEGKDDLWAGTSDEDQLKNYAVYNANSQNRTAPVGTDPERKPNDRGLFDMSGNVFEWVEDCVHGNYNEAPKDGTAWLEANGGNCQMRVVRGGSWGDGPGVLRVSDRVWNCADFRDFVIGFRLAQDLP